jgi:hypothetical protein
MYRHNIHLQKPLGGGVNDTRDLMAIKLSKSVIPPSASFQNYSELHSSISIYKIVKYNLLYRPTKNLLLKITINKF